MVLVKVLASKRFHLGKVNFQSKSNFRLSQVSEIGLVVELVVELVETLSRHQGFQSRLWKIGFGLFCKVHFTSKCHSLQSHFFSKRFGKSGSGVLVLSQFWF